MSGPVERSESRTTDVGGLAVRRALPRRGRRTVGAWCFVDHFGPAVGGASMLVGPHPHIGLQTVTWLVEGEVVHRDSLGTEQLIRPGQLNLMTAGNGVSHAEVGEHQAGLHGAQLWVAQPEATRHGEAAFEHHADLPEAGFGPVVATVLLGQVGGERAPGRTDTPLVGAALRSAPGGPATVPVDPAFEHALVVLDGAVAVDDEVVRPGELAYLGLDREALAVALEPGTHALLLGGEPFPDQLQMWWNFVGRDRAELERARLEWEAGADRFGTVEAPLPRVPAPAW